MTSEAIEESGVNVFMLALVPAIGRVRGRAVGTPSGLNTWGGIRTIPTGQSINDSRLSRHYSPVVRSVQSQSSSRLAFRSGVGGKPHRLWTKKQDRRWSATSDQEQLRAEPFEGHLALPAAFGQTAHATPPGEELS